MIKYQRYELQKKEKREEIKIKKGDNVVLSTKKHPKKKIVENVKFKKHCVIGEYIGKEKVLVQGNVYKIEDFCFVYKIEFPKINFK